MCFALLKDAEETLERIRTGADFEALAKKESVDRNSASRGGKMRPFGPQGVMGKAVANLKNGEVSEIIKTDSGYHIIKIEKRIPRNMKKFSEVKEDLCQACNRTESANKNKSMASKPCRKCGNYQEFAGVKVIVTSLLS